ncbi:hypothetical protein PIIN_03057 [Serendipita indica DSM 11827]|uniref:Multiple myeloma tumor-associated protein 2-like N-terminal domain-containing protein n=1 Tax=Serendipita indica (strain DSM 11827) TaxID=1109443 RepID=G4TCV8_SERID|nr:hypothetical protein PIIN_03057 [Serendipita indica DSM 11827]
MFEPTRGGTRGGAGEFKWSDVSADKDREHYLGHSVNAPTGRWQKNKDVHWYNRDKKQPEDERNAELLKIKEAEKEAMAAALGYGPSKPAGDTSTTGANAIPVAPKPDQNDDEDENNEEKKLSKEERKRLKAERKRLKEERKREERERRAMQAVSSSSRHRNDDDDRDYSRDRHRHSYDRRERSGGRTRSRSASPRRGERESKHRRRDSLGRKRSLTPLDDRPWMSSSKRDGKEDRDYTVEDMERERTRDRRRWEDNLTRQETAREKMRM